MSWRAVEPHESDPSCVCAHCGSCTVPRCLCLLHHVGPLTKSVRSQRGQRSLPTSRSLSHAATQASILAVFQGVVPALTATLCTTASAAEEGTPQVGFHGVPQTAWRLQVGALRQTPSTCASSADAQTAKLSTPRVLPVKASSPAPLLRCSAQRQAHRHRWRTLWFATTPRPSPLCTPTTTFPRTMKSTTTTCPTLQPTRRPAASAPAVGSGVDPVDPTSERSTRRRTAQMHHKKEASRNSECAVELVENAVSERSAF